MQRISVFFSSNHAFEVVTMSNMADETVSNTEFEQTFYLSLKPNLIIIQDENLLNILSSKLKHKITKLIE
jgi:hypothetical protein